MSAWPTFLQSDVAGSPHNQDFHRSVIMSGCSSSGKDSVKTKDLTQLSRSRSTSSAGCHLSLPTVTKVWGKALAQTVFVSDINDGGDTETCSSVGGGQQRESSLH